MAELEPHLSINQVGPIIGGINNEIKITLLHFTPPFESGEVMTPTGLVSNLRDIGAFDIARDMDSDGVDKIQRRQTSRGLITRVQGGFQRTLLGEVAAGAAGQLIDNGIRNCVPVKTITGEDGQSLRPDGTTSNGIESRLVILYNLYRQRPGSWLAMQSLLGTAADSGLNAGAVYKGVNSLEATKAIEKRRPNNSQGAPVEMRFRQVEGVDYRGAAGEYIETVKDLAKMDIPKLEAGRAKLEEVMTSAIDKGVLSLLLVRAQTTSTRPTQTTLVNGKHVSGAAATNSNGYHPTSRFTHY